MVLWKWKQKDGAGNVLKNDYVDRVIELWRNQTG